MDTDPEQIPLMINAWTDADGAPTGRFAPGWRRWSTRRQLPSERRAFLESEEPVDLRAWQDPRVGWGVVLAEDPNFTPAQRAVGADAPEPLRDLIADRKGPVFRYRSDLGTDKLERYYPDGTHQTIAISGSMRGVGRGQVPAYLLIYGSPKDIPWDLQYVLNMACCVGRLDLEKPELGHYVDALLSGWKDAPCRRDQPVVWATDYGGDDITTAMHQLIAGPVAAALKADNEVKNGRLVYLEGVRATWDALSQSLAEQTPALIVTTSHGKTDPASDKVEMARGLGLPVDANRATLAPDKLLARWSPYGAIWYAHACCSAGCDAKTAYKGLVKTDSSIAATLDAVAGLGAQVAPLPKLLLGVARPLRAFVGHVEPTFNWTIQQPDTKQPLTDGLREALHERLYRAQPEPVALAFARWYGAVGGLYAQWYQARDRVDQGQASARGDAMRLLLTALDRQSLVILGDPTAGPPALAARVAPKPPDAPGPEAHGQG
jgi:hypothetical protein